MDRIWIVAIALFGCNCGDELAPRVERRLEAEIPGAQASIVDPDTIVLTVGEAESRLSLANLRLECADGSSRCEDAIARTVAAAAQTAAELDGATVQRTSVRAALYGPEWIAEARAALGDRLVAKPFVGDLTMVYVVDLPDAIRNLSPGDMETLGLDEASVHALAIENLRAAATDFTLQPMGADPRLHRLHVGDSYEAARMLLVDRWAPIAERVEGDLIVSVPSRDNVLVTGAGSPENVATLRAMTNVAYAQESHPLSRMMFKWSRDGWTTFEP